MQIAAHSVCYFFIAICTNLRMTVNLMQILVVLYYKWSMPGGTYRKVSKTHTL